MKKISYYTRPNCGLHSFSYIHNYSDAHRIHKYTYHTDCLDRHNTVQACTENVSRLFPVNRQPYSASSFYTYTFHLAVKHD